MKNLKKMKWIILGLLSLSLALAACAPSVPPTPSEAEIAQQVAATQQAKATQNSVETLVALVTQLSNQPTWTPQPTCPACPTQVVVPTAQTTAEPTAAVPTEEPGVKCIQFEFLGDVNYPPGTVMKPGTKFNKTWTIKNTGTCTWDNDFDLYLSGGEAFGTNKYGDVPSGVIPGETIDVTVYNMVAPMTEGTYYSYWILLTPDGSRVGYGPEQQWSLGIQIVVSND